MINDIFNFLIDNNDKLSLIYSDNYSFENRNIYVYETKDSKIILITDKHIKPLRIDIKRKKENKI